MGKRNRERTFRKVQSKTLKKGVLIISAVLLMIVGLSWAWKYAKYRIPVPPDAVSAKNYRMEDGSIYVRIQVEEDYSVTHGWEWTSDMPIRVRAGMDQMRFSWLSWLEAYLPATEKGYDTNEMVLVIPKEEAGDAVVLYEEQDESGDSAVKVLYDRGSELLEATEEMEERVKDHEVYNYWLVDAPEDK